MHDHLGKPLKRGDLVLVPMIIDQVHPNPDFCNITLRTVQKRKPDGYRDVFTTNANVVFRAGNGDEDILNAQGMGDSCTALFAGDHQDLIDTYNLEQREEAPTEEHTE